MEFQSGVLILDRTALHSDIDGVLGALAHTQQAAVFIEDTDAFDLIGVETLNFDPQIACLNRYPEPTDAFLDGNRLVGLSIGIYIGDGVGRNLADVAINRNPRCIRPYP